MVKKPTGTTSYLMFNEAGAVIEVNSLPIVKEEIENLFAQSFQFDCQNGQFTGYADFAISEQFDTSDLDFGCKLGGADLYLELAEIAPIGSILKPHEEGVVELGKHQIVKWIYKNLIDKKQKKYGETAKRTILLLYATRSQVQMGPNDMDDLRRLLRKYRSRFHSIFITKPFGPAKVGCIHFEKVFGNGRTTPNILPESKAIYGGSIFIQPHQMERTATGGLTIDLGKSLRRFNPNE